MFFLGSVKLDRFRKGDKVGNVNRECTCRRVGSTVGAGPTVKEIVLLGVVPDI
jgi:hypothetical protein